MLKSWEGYNKNWMHFMYKLDHLIRSIRVSDENSSVTKAFHFFKLISTPEFLCVHYAPFEPTSSVFKPFWLHLLFFMHLLIFLAEWPWNWKVLQITIRKGWKLAWYHHFTHIACAKKLRGLRQKLDALHVQTGPSPLKYEGFGREIICYKGISFF